MTRTQRTRASLLLLLLLTGMPAVGVEHPGVVPIGSDCAPCHAMKVSGKSVHSAMSTPCTVCHVARSQGDMTTLNLVMPKERICFACHEKSAELRQHVPAVKAQCLDCHDAHSSDRPMLLRAAYNLPALARKKR